MLLHLPKKIAAPKIYKATFFGYFWSFSWLSYTATATTTTVLVLNLISSIRLAMKLTPVVTPSGLTFQNEKRTLHELGSILTSEMNTYGCWTPECTSLLTENPKWLFLYDRFQFALGNAYGQSGYKILLNPMMMVCYHPSCLERRSGPVVRLKHPFFLKTYLTHLGLHCDELGDIMKKRFGVLKEDLFISSNSLDQVCRSPFSVQTDLRLNDKTVEVIQNFGITRELNMNYVCHWKDWLIQHRLIDCDSLTFQEDEALIDCALSYPNHVSDWKLWKTIYLYGLKFLTSISTAGLNLYRGITNYPLLNHDSSHDNDDVFDFISTINHPTASVTTFLGELPQLNYNNEMCHGGELLYHIKCLEKSSESLALTFKDHKVVRFPITAGIDDQELNPGTYCKDCVLHGLENKMTADEIKAVGYDNLCNHIAKNNKFLVSVREYRATDFKSIVCSNIFTQFLSHDFTGEKCIAELKRCVKFAKSCRMCLLEKVDCVYKRLDEPCSNCAQQRVPCVSLVVLHVLWDMGSGHKRAAKLYYHLEEDSTIDEFMSTDMFTIGFGGLHLGKSLVCTSRNYVLSYKGGHFGVNILNELKECCQILQEINNSVFVGRDKQSDLLNFLLIGPKVQYSLSRKDKYLVTRVPEKFLTYKENAKTHKRIVMPVAICTNRNGDIFVLDAGACCIHVIDNSSVAKVTILGCYEKPSLAPHTAGATIVKDLMLGNDLKDIQIHHQNDNIFVLDESRSEIILIESCMLAKKVLNCKFFIMKANQVKAILLKGSDLFTLEKSDDMLNGNVIHQVKIDKKKGSKNLINYNIIKSFDVSQLGNIITIFDLPFANMIGSFNENKTLSTISYDSDVINVQNLDVECNAKPFVSSDGRMLCWSRDRILSMHKLSQSQNSLSTVLLDSLSIEGSVRAIFLRESVVSIVAALDKSKCINQFSVLEWGDLHFSRMYCNAVEKLYHAICYVPPFGNRQERCVSLDESIEAAEVCCKLLLEMQNEKEAMFTGRKSFIGCEGIPWTETISSLKRTIQSWRILIARMEVLQPGSSKLIVPRSVCNESYVEHSFGFTKKKGQGNNQSQEEYIQSKRRHMIDFQMRMCKLPFCQYVKSKIRDKGYQEVDTARENQISMSLKEFREIFSYSACSTSTSDSSDNNSSLRECNDEDKQVVKKAHLLTKYVPRQSGRNRWRAAATQVPTMIVDQNCSHLYEGDLVFTRGLLGHLSPLIVKTTTMLLDVDSTVKVSVLENKNDSIVIVSQLIHVKQQILTVPTSFFTVADSVIQFTDEFQPLFEEIFSNIEPTCNVSEKEWSLIVNESTSSTSKQLTTKRKEDHEGEQEEESNNRKAKRRKQKQAVEGEQGESSTSRVESKDTQVTTKRKADHEGEQEEECNNGKAKRRKQKQAVDSALIPLIYEDVELLQWVMVIYEGAKFLGVCVDKRCGEYKILCLEKPYPINCEQEFEDDAIFYKTVYNAPVTPRNPELDDEGNIIRSEKIWFDI